MRWGEMGGAANITQKYGLVMVGVMGAGHWGLRLRFDNWMYVVPSSSWAYACVVYKAAL